MMLVMVAVVGTGRSIVCGPAAGPLRRPRIGLEHGDRFLVVGFGLRVEEGAEIAV